MRVRSSSSGPARCLRQPDPVSSAFDRLGFTQSRLIRHSAERDGDHVAAGADPGAGLVLVAGDRIVLLAGPSPSAILERTAPRQSEVFLGRIGGRPVFTAALAPEEFSAFPQPDFTIRDLRAIAAESLVAPEEIGLLATAKSLITWHARHGFCAQCGTPTQVAAGGFRRDCPSCGAHHFPRTDPVAIMLIQHGDSCLLGRSPHYREGMYSCLAGFIEPGETIEDAVRRETLEEAGIRVGAVRYRASQPWPFPASLMIGCVAEAENDTIAIDPAELADARWFDRDELAAMFEGRHPQGLFLPPPMAIAHGLVREFCEAGRQ